MRKNESNSDFFSSVLFILFRNKLVHTFSNQLNLISPNQKLYCLLLAVISWIVIL